jgi:hypothetical protein
MIAAPESIFNNSLLSIVLFIEVPPDGWTVKDRNLLFPRRDEFPPSALNSPSFYDDVTQAVFSFFFSFLLLSSH